jgi:hypothetical protein
MVEGKTVQNRVGLTPFSRPLKVQVGIRDHWSNKDSPLQKSLQELNELLGHTASVDPEWPQLLAELDSFYADKNNFVAIIAGCVQTWAKSLMELLEDTAHEEWTETLVERTAEAGSLLRVFLEVRYAHYVSPDVSVS